MANERYEPILPPPVPPGGRKRLEFHSYDSPTRSGHTGQPGDTRYDLKFTLDTGEELYVYVGEQGFAGFRDMLRQMDRDDALERANSGLPQRV